MSIALKTDCFDDVFGLSRTECDCFDVPTNISKTGLFLAEIEGLNLQIIDGASDCEDGDLWDLMKRAREQAIIAFKTDYSAQISTQWKQKLIPFKGEIGRREFNSDYPIKAFAGQSYVFAPIKNGVFVIKRIGVAFNTTGTVDINIYRNVDNDVYQTIAGIPTLANTLSWYTLPQPLELPIYDEGTEFLQYIFAYANTGARPKDNHLKCCSTVLNYSLYNPILQLSISDQRYAFARWCNVTGLTYDSIAEFKRYPSGFANHAMGLIMDSEIRCDYRGIACNDDDFKHSDIMTVMAYATYYRAGAYLVDAILSSTNINRYTMLDRERLYGKKSSYLKEYRDRLQWLVNPDVESVKNFLLQTGCVECLTRMSMGSTLK